MGLFIAPHRRVVTWVWMWEKAIICSIFRMKTSDDVTNSQFEYEENTVNIKFCSKLCSYCSSKIIRNTAKVNNVDYTQTAICHSLANKRAMRWVVSGEKNSIQTFIWVAVLPFIPFRSPQNIFAWKNQLKRTWHSSSCFRLFRRDVHTRRTSTRIVCVVLSLLWFL